MHQGERYGEPQDILNTAKDLAIAKEVQRLARLWAKQQPDLYAVREVNGQEAIERLSDGSRWMLRSRTGVYGYAVSVGAVDEGWKVAASVVEEGLLPTMVERIEPQLWLVSTAHRMATGLMLGRRREALEHLETGRGDLLIEWSAPREAALDDVDAWKQASPHWTPQRERLIGKRCEAARNGENDDPDEPDPDRELPLAVDERVAETQDGAARRGAGPVPGGAVGIARAADAVERGAAVRRHRG